MYLVLNRAINAGGRAIRTASLGHTPSRWSQDSPGYTATEPPASSTPIVLQQPTAQGSCQLRGPVISSVSCQPRQAGGTFKAFSWASPNLGVPWLTAHIQGTSFCTFATSNEQKPDVTLVDGPAKLPSTMSASPSSPEADTEEEEEEDDPRMCIRGNWMLDRCSTMDEIIQRLYEEIENFKKLKEEGWEFETPMSDDWGYLTQDAKDFYNSCKPAEQEPNDAELVTGSAQLPSSVNVFLLPPDKEEEEGEEDVWIRAKWMLEGCESMDEIIQRLYDEIEGYTKLKEEGWQLTAPIITTLGI